MSCLAHRVIRMLPSKWQGSIEQESREWVMRCPCGTETSIWEMGGVRYKAAGNPVRSGRCAKCGQQFVGQVYRREGVGAVSKFPDTLSDSSTVLPLPLKASQLSSVQERPGASPSRGGTGILWIDGVGCFQFISGNRVTIGSHTSDGSGANLRLLAPLNREQAAIVRSGEGYWLEALEPRTASNPKSGRLLRSGDVFEIGGGVRLRLRTPNSLSQSAVLEFVSPHRPVQRVDGVVLMDQVCILGAAEDAHVRCPHWQNPLVLFRRQGSLWCKGTGLSLNGAAAGPEFSLSNGAVVTGEDLRLRIELSCE